MMLLLTTEDNLSQISASLRQQRISMDMTQAQLAEQANVSLAVLRKFEQTGKVSLESFVKLAFVLGLAEPILNALQPRAEGAVSLDDLLAKDSKPKRKYAYSPRKKRDD